MGYSIARLVDPFRGIFEILETVDDYEVAWQRAGSARAICPAHIFFVMSTETREDPKPQIKAARHLRE